MPHRAPTQAGTRVRTSTGQQRVGLSARSGIFGASGASAAQDAQAIADALGVTTRIGEIQQRQQIAEDVVRAETDFQQGVALGDDPSVARRVAYMRVKAQADFAADAKGIDETLNTLDLDNMSAEDLDLHITESITAQLEGIEDDSYAQTYTALAGRYRNERIAQHQERIAQVINEQGQANLAASVEQRYIEHRLNDVEFDYNQLHTDAMDLSPGGAEANELMFQILAGEAIKNGDPELLDNIPDEWEDGQRTFKHIPAFQENLRAARASAQRVAEDRARDAAKASEAEAERELSALTVQAIDGIDVRQAVKQGLDEGRFKSKQVRPLVTFFQGQRDDIRGEAPNDALLAAIQSRIVDSPGALNAADLLDMFNAGVFGDRNSPEARNLYRQYAQDLQEAKDRSNRAATSNPRVRAFRDEFKAITQFQTDARGNPFGVSREEVSLTSEMRRRWDERVIVNREDPSAVSTELRQEYNERRAAITRGRDIGLSTALTKDQAYDKLRRREIEPQDVRASLEANGISIEETINELQERDPDLLLRILEAY